jgi:demethylmenaquinone methyltransferase/2-methoxy-6-polyprenyl-1,4-benzoquinol methylase
MPCKKDQEKVSHVRRMFGRISGKYDLMNRLMTFNRDRTWRRFLISIASVPKGGRMLDVGTGTGDIAFEAFRVDPTAFVTGLDFTREMMEIGRKREDSRRIGWCQADALRLPFPDAAFDAVTSGFLIRNVLDAPSVFREQVRVVKPGGRVVCLDTSPAPRNIVRPFAMFYLKILIPSLGRLITGEKDAYSYLYMSTLDFMEPNVLADIMKGAGLEDVAFRRFMFGNISVHWGMRPFPHATTR